MSDFGPINVIVRLVAADLRNVGVQPELKPLLDEAFRLKDEGVQPGDIAEKLRAIDGLVGFTGAMSNRANAMLKLELG